MIETLPNGKYRARFYRGGLHLGKTRATRREAELDEAQLKLAVGLKPLPVGGVPLPDRKQTVGQLIAMRLEVGGYSPSTLAAWRTLSKSIPEGLMSHPASTLTTPLLATYLQRIDKPDYRRRIQHMISRAYRDAIVRGEVDRNPADGISAPPVKSVEVVPPTSEQVAAMIQAARAHSPAFGTYVALSASLGCRRGEMVALRFEDFSANSEVIIRRSLVGNQRIVRPTKTGERAHRTLAFPAALYDEVQTLRGDGPWVFSFDGGQTPWEPNYPSQTLRKLNSGFTLHSLRHYVATFLLGNGASIQDVAHRLGDSVAVVAKTYVHYIPAKDRALADALGKALGY